MEQSEQDLPLWARLKQQRLNREQSARAEKEDGKQGDVGEYE